MLRGIQPAQHQVGDLLQHAHQHHVVPAAVHQVCEQQLQIGHGQILAAYHHGGTELQDPLEGPIIRAALVALEQAGLSDRPARLVEQAASETESGLLQRLTKLIDLLPGKAVAQGEHQLRSQLRL